MNDGGKVLISISLGKWIWAGLLDRMGRLLRCIIVEITGGQKNVVNVFVEVFKRQEGNVNVKLGEEKMVRMEVDL